MRHHYLYRFWIASIVIVIIVDGTSKTTIITYLKAIKIQFHVEDANYVEEEMLPNGTYLTKQFEEGKGVATCSNLDSRRTLIIADKSGVCK